MAQRLGLSVASKRSSLRNEYRQPWGSPRNAAFMRALTDSMSDTPMMSVLTAFSSQTADIDPKVVDQPIQIGE